METEVVRRRMNKLAAHFAPNEDIPSTHLLPMNCSSSLNSVMPRYDNRLNFARQGSASQAFFMRQAPTDQPCNLDKCSASATQRPCYTSQEPAFSRPAKIEPKVSHSDVIQDPLKDYRPPKFARPNRRPTEMEQVNSVKKIQSSSYNGVEWSPRMDVVESGGKYVLMVEIPGVNVNDIRVEISDKKLTVTGKRFPTCRMLAGSQNDAFSTYHKREILQGPYQVVWPLPSNVNKDSVSAEFLDGVLRIIVPKL